MTFTFKLNATDLFGNVIFTGACQVDADCMNGGTCLHRSKIHNNLCTCAGGYFGNVCQFGMYLRITEVKGI